MKPETDWMPAQWSGRYETRINQCGHVETRPNRPPILEYSQSRVGQIWTQEDAEYLAHTLHRVKRLAEDMVRRVMQECGAERVAK